MMSAVCLKIAKLHSFLVILRISHHFEIFPALCENFSPFWNSLAVLKICRHFEIFPAFWDFPSKSHGSTFYSILILSTDPWIYRPIHAFTERSTNPQPTTRSIYLPSPHPSLTSSPPPPLTLTTPYHQPPDPWIHSPWIFLVTDDDDGRR